MTNKEIVKRNIGLTFDLIRKIIENPDLADRIPDNSVIEFVEKDFEVRKKAYAKNSKLIKGHLEKLLFLNVIIHAKYIFLFSKNLILPPPLFFI